MALLPAGNSIGMVAGPWLLLRLHDKGQPLAPGLVRAWPGWP